MIGLILGFGTLVYVLSGSMPPEAAYVAAGGLGFCLAIEGIVEILEGK